jgi:pilus assembly protein Flp/PilA
MTPLSTLLANLAADESGQDLVEYALIVGIMALASIAILQSLATSITTAFSGIGARITGAI